MKAIIFDMDGVIVDTEPLNRQAALQFANDYQLNLTEQAYNTIIGTNNFFNMLQTLNPNIDVMPLQEAYCRYQKEKRIDYQSIFHVGLPALLATLKNNNYYLAVASSSSEQTIRKVLSACNIMQYFDVILSGKQVKRGKPYPDIFLQVARLLHISPTCCLVIEDSHNGIKAAKDAGMKVIGVKNKSYALDLSQATSVVKSMNEINFEYIETVFQKEK